MIVTEKTNSRWRLKARALIRDVLVDLPTDASCKMMLDALLDACPWRGARYPLDCWRKESMLALSPPVKMPSIPDWYPVLNEQDRAFLDTIRQSDLDRSNFTFDATDMSAYGDWLQEQGQARGEAWALLADRIHWPAAHGKRWWWKPWKGHTLRDRSELKEEVYGRLIHGGIYVHNTRKYYNDKCYHEYHSIFHALADYALAWPGT